MITRTRATVLFLVAVALFLAIAFYSFRQVDWSALINRLSAQDIILNLLLALGFFASTGLVMRAAFKSHYEVVFTPAEVITLPLMMHLFTYLVPLNGGLLFQMFYLRKRYDLELNKGFSLGVTVFVSGLLVSVVLGIGLAFYLGWDAAPLVWMLVAMGGALMAFLLALAFVPLQPGTGEGKVQSAMAFLANSRDQLNQQMTHPSLLINLVFTSIISALALALWYQHTAMILGFESQFLSMLLIALVLRIVLLFRLLPGNLGFQELVIGIVFISSGFTVEEGLTVALFIRLVSVVLAATIGLASIYHSLRYFSTSSLRPVIAEVSKRQ